MVAVSKVACVTGGAAGIGLATVEALHARGYLVSILDINADVAGVAERRLRAIGCSPIFRIGSASNQGVVESWIKDTELAWGRLDSLVNIAGIRKYGKLSDTSITDWREIFEINVFSVALCSRAAVPRMEVTGGGSIVNMSSIRAYASGGNTTLYEASKAAILGLTRGMAVDYAPMRIRVNAVAPGPIMTDYHKEYIAIRGFDETDYRREYSANTVMGRAGEPEEVAAAIVFLLSDEASYITGSSLVVDGGQLAYSPNAVAARADEVVVRSKGDETVG